jgi:Bacterial extracellular solute-binding protein, family 7
MSQGLSVDYAIVAPSHMATFSKQATLMDMPFLFRDIDHWNKVLSTGEALQPIADDVLKKADVMLIGYAGGGVRNVVANKPVRNMAELKGLNIRVMGAPIQTRMFQAITAAPTVIAYDEVYNAIQTNVIQAGENEAPGWAQMKWFEVASDISLTQHAITIRPLCIAAPRRAGAHASRALRHHRGRLPRLLPLDSALRAVPAHLVHHRTDHGGRVHQGRRDSPGRDAGDARVHHLLPGRDPLLPPPHHAQVRLIAAASLVALSRLRGRDRALPHEDVDRHLVQHGERLGRDGLEESPVPRANSPPGRG